jgi:hypothetical protein
MNIEHYHKFLTFQESGLKKKATDSLRSFISSFESTGDINGWVWENIAELGSNPSSRVRYEIFHELVYPVLKAGYIEGEFSSTLWLAKLIQNIYQAPKTHEELDWVSEMELLRKCHELKPENDEARLLLLECIVKWLQYTEHEWPSGILYGNDGATLEQCGEITQEIELVLSLDKEYQYSEFIKQYTKKLVQYRARLNK